MAVPADDTWDWIMDLDEKANSTNERSFAPVLEEKNRSSWEVCQNLQITQLLCLIICIWTVYISIVIAPAPALSANNTQR